MATLLALARWTGKATYEMEEAAFYGASLKTFDLIAADSDLEALHHFLSNGWGRLAGVEHAREAGHEAECGSTEDPYLMMKLLWSQPHLENPTEACTILHKAGIGLCWS